MIGLIRGSRTMYYNGAYYMADVPGTKWSYGHYLYAAQGLTRYYNSLH